MKVHELIETFEREHKDMEVLIRDEVGNRVIRSYKGKISIKKYSSGLPLFIDAGRDVLVITA